MAHAEANRGGKPVTEAKGADPKRVDEPKGEEKKGGLFSRLFHKAPAKADPKFDAGRTATERGTAAADSAANARKTQNFPTIVRKVSKKEETAIKISEGLNELSQLVRCVGDQLDTDGKSRAEIAQAVEPLKEFLTDYPVTAERSNKALEGIREEVVTQRKSAEALLEKVSALPDSIRELPAVGKQQVTILQGVLRNVEEHNRKLTQVLNTVENATTKNVEAIRDMKDLQQEALEVMTRNQQETYREFDRRSLRQQKEVAGMLTKTHRHHAVLMVVFLLVTLCAVSLAALFTKGKSGPIEANSAKPEISVPLTNP